MAWFLTVIMYHRSVHQPVPLLWRVNTPSNLVSLKCSCFCCNHNYFLTHALTHSLTHLLTYLLHLEPSWQNLSARPDQAWHLLFPYSLAQYHLDCVVLGLSWFGWPCCGSQKSFSEAVSSLWRAQWPGCDDRLSRIISWLLEYVRVIMIQPVIMATGQKE